MIYKRNLSAGTTFTSSIGKIDDLDTAYGLGITVKF